MDSVEQSHLLTKHTHWRLHALTKETGLWPSAHKLLTAMSVFHFSPCPLNYLVATLALALTHLKYCEYHDGMLSFTTTSVLNRAENERGRGSMQTWISILTEVPMTQILIYFLNDQRIKMMGNGIKIGHYWAI